MTKSKKDNIYYNMKFRPSKEIRQTSSLQNMSRSWNSLLLWMSHYSFPSFIQHNKFTMMFLLFKLLMRSYKELEMLMFQQNYGLLISGVGYKGNSTTCIYSDWVYKPVKLKKGKCFDGAILCIMYLYSKCPFA